MVIAAVMAGGSGSRMGCTDVPKQFINLGSKPVIIHTLSKFLYHPQVDKVVVMCPSQWVGYTQTLIEKFLPDAQGKIFVSKGGKTRNATLENAIGFIYEHLRPDEGSVILTHDAVRPFVTDEIISENIAAASLHGACNTAWGATDTLAVSRDGVFIEEVPDRSVYYHSQTPQSFNLRLLTDTLAELTREEKEKLTDACMIFAMRGKKVFIVKGSPYNIKITWPQDLAIAEKLLEADKI